MLRFNEKNKFQEQVSRTSFKNYVLLILSFVMLPIINLKAEEPNKLPKINMKTDLHTFQKTINFQKN